MKKFGFDIRWSDEDQEYIATSPDFPGLSALGETIEEALQEAQIALGLFIKSYSKAGKKIPEPTEVREYSGQTRLRMPPTIHARLAQLAESEGVSLNHYINMLLTLMLGQQSLIDQITPQLNRIEQKAEASASYLSGKVFSQIKGVQTYNPSHPSYGIFEREETDELH